MSEAPCENGFCILESKFCDGSIDCPDNSDELYCQDDCQDEDHYRCGNPPKCIFKEWR